MDFARFPAGPTRLVAIPHALANQVVVYCPGRKQRRNRQRVVVGLFIGNDEQTVPPRSIATSGWAQPIHRRCSKAVPPPPVTLILRVAGLPGRVNRRGAKLRFGSAFNARQLMRSQHGRLQCDQPRGRRPLRQQVGPLPSKHAQDS